VTFTFGLKLNSITVPGSSVMLFEENIKAPPGPTSTLVFLNPPTGSPLAGEVLVEDLLAANLYASKVFAPVVALGKY